MATFKFTGGSPFQREADRGHGRPRLSARVRRAHLPQLEGFGSYGFPRAMPPALPRSPMRAVDEAPSSRRVLRRAETRSRVSTRLRRSSRCARTWRRGAAVLRQRQSLGLHARADSGRYLAVRLGSAAWRGLSNADGAKIVSARSTTAYDCVEDVWRRSGTARSDREAGGRRCLPQLRRRSPAGPLEGEGLGEAPLPLFACGGPRGRDTRAEGSSQRCSCRR
jgi:error-prone DNA polymerase